MIKDINDYINVYSHNVSAPYNTVPPKFTIDSAAAPLHSTNPALNGIFDDFSTANRDRRCSVTKADEGFEDEATPPRRRTKQQSGEEGSSRMAWRK
jgi:hypothetical protein